MIFKIAAAIALIALVRLVEHANVDYSPEVGSMVIKGGILGVMIAGLLVFDLLSVPSNVQKK